MEMDEKKLKQFLMHTKVWEYFRITEEDHNKMPPVDRFEMLKDYYNYMDKRRNQEQIETATASRIKNAIVVTLSKKGAGSNFFTMLVAENKDDNISEISGEPIWNKFGYFGQLRTDFNLEKVNFTENGLFYINQAFLTVQKSKKIFYGEYFLLGQIHESSNLPSNIESYECKEDDIKYYRPRYDKNTRKFLGICKTIGFLMVRGDPYELFLSYG